MPFDTVQNSIFYAAIASLALSFVSLGCIVYFKKSKTTYNEKKRRIEMDIMRSSFEERIYLLTERMQKDPSRWRDVNHLIIEGNMQEPLKSDLYSQSSNAPRINPNHFFEELGINVGALEVVPNQVFVLTPFHEMYEKTYATIKAACKLNDLVAVRGDEKFKSGNILRHIIEQILVSPYVIANINGRNPNVHYELGIAHSLGKNILLVSEGLDDVAFDLKSERILTYSSQKDLNMKLYIYYAKLLAGK